MQDLRAANKSIATVVLVTVEIEIEIVAAEKADLARINRAQAAISQEPNLAMDKASSEKGIEIVKVAVTNTDLTPQRLPQRKARALVRKCQGSLRNFLAASEVLPAEATKYFIAVIERVRKIFHLIATR